MTIRQGDLDVLCEAIRGDVFDSNGVIFVEDSRDDSNGCFNTMFARLNAALVCQGFHDAYRAMKAGVKAGEIIEEDNSGDAGGICRFAEAGSDNGVETAGLINEGRANPVGLVLEEIASGNSSDGEVEPGDDGAGGFAAGVGVDDLHGVVEDGGEAGLPARSPYYLPSQLLHQLRKRACWLWRNCF